MPVTAKLSRKFYEKLGDDVANELVEWLNAVDTSYRQEFKDLFEANFGQVRAEMAQLRAEYRAEMGQFRAEIRTEIAQTKDSLIHWMFGFWIGQLAISVGVIIAVKQLLR